MVSNIDPVYFLTPTVVIGFSLAFILYWRVRGRLTGSVLLTSFFAYFSAIAIKELIQYFALSDVTKASDANPVVMGVYYGSQTVVFEVGLAYLVAWWATKRKALKVEYAQGYGLSLGFWEDAVLVAIPLLLDYTVYYVTLSGSGSTSQTLFGLLHSRAPELFYPAKKALPLVALSILERVSSFISHFSWGYLCVLAAVFKKRRYLWAALPMGFVDFLVPFADTLGVLHFELLIFLLAALSFFVSQVITRGSNGPSLSQ
jgi:hypothetical protein